MHSILQATLVHSEQMDIEAPITWPALPWPAWEATAATLHMWMQIVGKTRLALTPRQNHWWNVPLYLTARGLSTSAMPLPNGELLDIEFDFLSHELVLRCSSGQSERIALRPQTVADFLTRYLAALSRLKAYVTLNLKPVEVPDPIAFDQDTTHQSYDAEAAQRFWRIVTLADKLLKRFSTNFYGKISPTHFFWGSFDLAVTRFNGERAPARPGADYIQTEAYSHQCISAGFWPGNSDYKQAAFYCYAAPVPDGLPAAKLAGAGSFDSKLGEFILPYEEARLTPDPAQTVLNFLGESYASAATIAGWDRENLDRRDAVGARATSVHK